MQISSKFDGGNISCLSIEDPTGDDPTSNDPCNIRLAIEKDSNADFLQWFYFRLTGARERDCRLVIANAGETSYTSGWKDYRAVCSYDRRDWFRVPTVFDGSSLVISHRPAWDAAYYAYFAPYSMERHADLIAGALATGAFRHELLGRSVDGQDLDLLVHGEAGPDNGTAEKRTCWIIARQHPGETMAEWWMEGFLERLGDPDDPVARAIRSRARLFIVPNVNPDGSRRGNLRTNAAGVNLNRAWAEPSPETSPEIFHLRARMVETGVDFFLDVHGDEGLPYNFVASSLGIPGLTEAQRDLTAAYKSALMRASPDFQTAKGYPENSPGKANLTIAANNIAENFGCLAMTLEQPFKDTADSPDERNGWSPARCRKLGAANLDALHAVLGDLR